MQHNAIQYFTKDVISIPIHPAQGRLREESLTITAVFFEKRNVMLYSILYKMFKPQPKKAAATMRE